MLEVSFSRAVDDWRFSSTFLNPSRFKIDVQGRTFAKFDDAFTYLDQNEIQVLTNDYFLVKSSLASIARVIVVLANGILVAPCGVVWNSGAMSYHYSKSLLNTYFYHNHPLSRVNLEKAKLSYRCFIEDFNYSIQGLSPIFLGIFFNLVMDFGSQLKDLPIVYDYWVENNIVYRRLRYDNKRSLLEAFFKLSVGGSCLSSVGLVFWLCNLASGFLDSTSAVIQKFKFHFPMNQVETPSQEESLKWARLYLGLYLHQNYGLSGPNGQVLSCESDLGLIDAQDFFNKQYNHVYGKEALKLAIQLSRLTGMTTTEIFSNSRGSLEETVNHIRDRSIQGAAIRASADPNEFIMLLQKAKQLDEKIRKLKVILQSWSFFYHKPMKLELFSELFPMKESKPDPLRLFDLSCVDLSKLPEGSKEKFNKYIQIREILNSKSFSDLKTLIDAIQPILRPDLRPEEKYSKTKFLRDFWRIFHTDKIQQALAGEPILGQLLEESQEIQKRFVNFVNRLDPS